MRRKNLHLCKDERYRAGIEWCIKTLKEYADTKYKPLEIRHIALILAANYLNDRGSNV